MRRREFITLFVGAAVWPFGARAQQRAGRVRRIAWLGIGRADEPSPYVDSLRVGLRELDWIEGSNLTIGLFWATSPEDMEAAAQSPTTIIANGVPRRMRLRRNTTPDAAIVNSAETSSRVSIDCHPFQKAP